MDSIPNKPEILTGIKGYDSGSYQTHGETTVVSLKKTDGTKEYYVTVTFDKPMDKDKIVEFLNEQQTKTKVDALAQQLDILADAYGKKKDFRLESSGDETFLRYTTGKKGKPKEFNLNEN